MGPEYEQFEELLQRAHAGDDAAWQRAFSIVYDELRAMARGRLARNGSPTLQATELVNEVYLRLFRRQNDCQNRSHFFAIASRAMQDILIERARRRGAVKRGGEFRRVEFEASLAFVDEHPSEFLTLSDAISRLSQHDPLSAEIVRLRFFVGLSGEEAGEALDVSASTVDRRWKYARAWLHEAIYGGFAAGT
jgi:RNA polymerase sigma factor (TIGR02999 family)